MSETKPRMQVRAWRRFRQGKILGFVTVDLPNGLQIADCMVLTGANGPYVRLPQRPKVQRGQLMRGVDGQVLYDAPIVWQSRELQDRWSAALIELLRASYPADLEPVAEAAQ